MKLRVPWLTAAALAPAWFIFVTSHLWDFLLLDRAAVSEGQWWRIYTGHWVHFSLAHVAVDTLMFGLCAAWIEQHSRKLLAALLVASPAFISGATLVLSPTMQSYGGLSGLAAAVMFCCWVLLWRKSGSLVPVGALGLLSAKIILDWAGLTPASGVLPPSVRLEPVSHAAGAVCGVVAAACTPLKRRVVHALQDARRLQDDKAGAAAASCVDSH